MVKSSSTRGLITKSGTCPFLPMINQRTDGRRSLTVANNLIGVNATGVNGGAIKTGIEINDGSTLINGNYFATNEDNGIFIDGEPIPPSAITILPIMGILPANPQLRSKTGMGS